MLFPPQLCPRLVLSLEMELVLISICRCHNSGKGFSLGAIQQVTCSRGLLCLNDV